jgi:hypothetical protein
LANKLAYTHVWLFQELLSKILIRGQKSSHNFITSQPVTSDRATGKK